MKESCESLTDLGACVSHYDELDNVLWMNFITCI
jgi:hypothetical protein